MKAVKHIAALGLLGTLAVVSVSADAATYIVPGIACHAQHPADAASMMYWPSGQIENEFTNVNLAVQCPLTRHNSSANLSGSAFVRVFNATSAAPLACNFSSYPSNSEAGDFVSLISNGTGYQSLTVDTTQLTLFTFGKYTVSCNLWQGDKIDSIRYTEP
jgi:hypothetical protein